MTGIIVCMIIMACTSICSVTYFCIISSKDSRCYEKQIKQLKKQVANRDRELELQKFVIETQSKLIEKMRS